GGGLRGGGGNRGGALLAALVLRPRGGRGVGIAAIPEAGRARAEKGRGAAAGHAGRFRGKTPEGSGTGFDEVDPPFRPTAALAPRPRGPAAPALAGVRAPLPDDAGIAALPRGALAADDGGAVEGGDSVSPALRRTGVIERTGRREGVGKALPPERGAVVRRVPGRRAERGLLDFLRAGSAALPRGDRGSLQTRRADAHRARLEGTAEARKALSLRRTLELLLAGLP